MILFVSLNGLSLPNPLQKTSSLKDLHARVACPDSLADAAVSEEQNERRDEEVCKGVVENVLGWFDPD